MSLSQGELLRTGRALFPLALCLSLWVPHRLHPQTPSDPNASVAQPLAPTVLQAYGLSEGMTIDLDGRIEEPAWAEALPIREFTQQEPVEGGQPSEPMEIRVLYDRDRLYIGVIVYDDPEQILAHQRERDAGLGTDDRFMWILDTFLDGRTGYFFEINPAGLMGDGLITGGGNINKSWDGIWEARTYRLDHGWSAEIELPFRTLNFDPALTTWGINFQRTIRRKNEEILWSGWRRNEGLFRPIYAGRMTGLEGLSQGLGLEAVPSTVVGWRDLADGPGGPSYPNEVSLDLNYSLTESLRASLSVNTDFAEVESDQRRVNLTRFPLFFPEQRDFFLEGSGVFSFAPRSNPRPFFSRRIGLQQGAQIPLDGGVRLTGQAGRYDLGFYQIRTGSSTLPSAAEAEPDVFVPREDFTVARVRRQVLEQSSVGVIYTRRASAADHTGVAPEVAHTVGLDLQLSTRSFLGDNNAEMEAFLVWNSNPNPSVDPGFSSLSARGFRVNFPNDIWSGHLSYREFGEHYDPEVGFVTRNDFRRVEPRIGWSPRPEGISWIRQFDFAVQFRNLTELGTGRLEEREWFFNVLGVELESGDDLGLNVVRSFERLYDPFEISDGIEIEPGGYAAWRTSLRAQTAGRRPVSAFGELGIGEFWDGDIREISAGVTVRPNPGMSLSVDLEHNDVDLHSGAFSANVYQLESDWHPSPWVGATTQLQYDDVSRIVSLFARLRWIVTPGTDVYFVYTQNWRNEDRGPLDAGGLATLSRGATLKANYTYRF